MSNGDADVSAFWASMTSSDTPSAGRCWWGWGDVSYYERRQLGPEDMLVVPPTVDQTMIPAPRIVIEAHLPAAVRDCCTVDKFERLLHCGGRDMIDIIKNIHNDLEGRVPDVVAFPANETEIGTLLSCCERNRWACIVWGGGSSVVQGVEPPPAEAGYTATLTIDMRKMSHVLEVDEVSMCVHVEAGLYGPDLEKELKRHGLSLRYYPQSFEFSTIGGWVATRGGGHFATGPTHIDDMVQSLRVVSPAGITETPRLPASGAGPAEHRHYIGSEGIYGIITSCWLRVLPRPQYRASAVSLFPALSSPEESFLCGTRALRAVVQSGLRPANLRLVDGAEMVRMTGEAGAKEGCATMLLGLESATWDDLTLTLILTLILTLTLTLPLTQTLTQTLTLTLTHPNQDIYTQS